MTANPTPAAEAVDVERLSDFRLGELGEEPGVYQLVAFKPFPEALCNFEGMDALKRARQVQRMLNDAAAAERRAAELAAQNAALRAACEAVKGYAPIQSPMLRRTLDTALATTPAEALAVVRDVTSLAEAWEDQNGARTSATQRARRLFGSAR